MNSSNAARKLRFAKMHGAGNDFIVLNGIDQDLSDITREQWQKLAHRQFGIGADQILLVEKAARPDADFRYRIFNADGLCALCSIKVSLAKTPCALKLHIQSSP